MPGQPPGPTSVGAPPFPFFVQLRTSRGQLHYETSSDGVNWTTIRSITRPGFLGGANMNVVAGNWMEVAQTHTARAGQVEVCANGSL